MTGEDGHRGRVAVLGSVNLDLVLRVNELPNKGETVLSQSSTPRLGGKGANQAAAAANVGADVALLGAVGNDEEGSRLIAKLVSLGVGADRLRRIDGVPSGLAVVVVSTGGENQIVVASGANNLVDVDYVESVSQTIAAADVLVLQAELPPDLDHTAISVAQAAATRLVLNLAPVRDLGDLLQAADPLVLNEIEAGQFLGVTLSGPDDLRPVADQLRRRARSVVVTIGAQGAVLVTRDDVVHVPAPTVSEAKDTTGAGDTVVGVLAASLAQGLELAAAFDVAVGAASRSVSIDGASGRDLEAVGA